MTTSAWDWQIFCKSTLDDIRYPSCFAPKGDITYFQWMLSAWGWTLLEAGTALLVALVLGSLMGVFRTTPHKALRWVGEVWTELFRNIPVLVQIVLWYHVLPALVPVLQGVPSFVLAAAGLGFFTSARISEQVKAGIQSLPKGQGQAGLALGFTWVQTYRYVLLPVAFRVVIPPLTSEAMSIVKNSAVAFAVGIAELAMFARQAQEETSRGIEIYLGVTLLYVLSNLVLVGVASLVEKRLRIAGSIGSST